MLTELEQLQESDESVSNVKLSFDIETRSEEGGELVHKEYVFSYADGFGKWMFHKYHEKRTPDTAKMEDRDWHQSRNIVWTETDEVPTIDVPPEVSQSLAEATGAESVTIQMPAGTIREHKYEQYTYTVDE